MRWSFSSEIVCPIFPQGCLIRHIPIKRIFDILFSLLFLLIFTPLFCIITLAVKCSSQGDIFYKHVRIGRGGKRFYCYKFRTMYPNADERLAQLLDSDNTLREEWEKNYKLKNDPRITPIGHLLRRTSLDELPQFFNALKGDLSIVGPRPLVQDEVIRYFGPKATKILSIRPGITGLWQTSGRNDVSYQSRIQLDEHYINNQSLVLDLILILKTIPVIIFQRGAY